MRPQGVGDNECSEMVTCGLQVDSVSRPVMMLLKMLMAVLHMVNLQTTSLCSTTFTDVDYTYCLIKILEICIVVVTVLCIVCTVIVLFHLCIFILICFVCTGVKTTAIE